MVGSRYRNNTLHIRSVYISFRLTSMHTNELAQFAFPFPFSVRRTTCKLCFFHNLAKKKKRLVRLAGLCVVGNNQNESNNNKKNEYTLANIIKQVSAFQSINIVVVVVVVGSKQILAHFSWLNYIHTHIFAHGTCFLMRKRYTRNSLFSAYRP